MGSEYFINSQELENKVRDLLPSQGGAGAGFDLSASTQIIPIIDLTESAEGSSVRADLQTSLSFDSVTNHNVINTTSTLINTTGYWRVFGNSQLYTGGASTVSNQFSLTDGLTTKIIYQIAYISLGVNEIAVNPYDFVVFLKAGESLTGTSSSTANALRGCSRQIATIDGTLVNPN